MKHNAPERIKLRRMWKNEYRPDRMCLNSFACVVPLVDRGNGFVWYGMVYEYMSIDIAADGVKEWSDDIEFNQVQELLHDSTLILIGNFYYLINTSINQYFLLLNRYFLILNRCFQILNRFFLILNRRFIQVACNWRCYRNRRYYMAFYSSCF